MAKSRDNAVTPAHYLERYSADAVRHWAASARLGVDTAFDETAFKIGRRLVLKLFNAARFVLSQTAEEHQHSIAHPLDRAFLGELRSLVADATTDYDAFRYADALARIEQFFWSRFADVYIELVKGRARGDHGTSADRGSAVRALELALHVLLRLFAPVLPYVTEHAWQWRFAREAGQPSIHRAPWPSPDEVAVAPADGLFEIAAAALAAVRKAKAEQKASVGRDVTDLALTANARTLAALVPVLDDVVSAARAPACECIEDPLLLDGEFRVSRLALAPAARAQR
jgi:valyl-tRNA synthetase